MGYEYLNQFQRLCLFKERNTYLIGAITKFVAFLEKFENPDIMENLSYPRL